MPPPLLEAGAMDKVSFGHEDVAPEEKTRRVRGVFSSVAASYDVMAGAPYMRTAAERLEGATYVELLGSHFIQLERPDEVHALLLEFLQRVD